MARFQNFAPIPNLIIVASRPRTGLKTNVAAFQSTSDENGIPSRESTIKASAVQPIKNAADFKNLETLPAVTAKRRKTR